jgi:hypothetical protein
MQNHKKQDSISVNIINQEDDVIPVSQKPVGNADKDPFCVYNHKRHAVESKIINEDGSESICTKDGTWRNR